MSEAASTQRITCLLCDNPSPESLYCSDDCALEGALLIAFQRSFYAYAGAASERTTHHD